MGYLVKYTLSILFLLLWIFTIYYALDSGNFLLILLGGWLGWMFFFVMKIPQVMWKDFSEDAKSASDSFKKKD